MMRLFHGTAWVSLLLLGFGRLAAADDRIAKFDGDRTAAISYTFDDALRDQYMLAVPMLNEVGFKGTFFVIPGVVAETVEQAKAKERDKRAWGSITWDELKEISAQGHEIASHSWSHPNLQKLSPEDLDAQLKKAYDEINKRIGKPPLTLAFPFNASTPEVQAAALKYHVAYRSYQTATGVKTTTESLNAWADKLVKDRKWGVVMTHAVADGYSAMSNREVFCGHLKYVKAHEQEIWVDTFANLARYEKERDNAKLSVTDTGHGCTISLTDALDPVLYDVPLTIVLDRAGVTSARAERAGKELPLEVRKGSISVRAVPSTQLISVTWK